MPSQPARRLPPGIIDIAAPQLPLEGRQAAHDAQQPAQPAPSVVRLRHPAPYALTASEHRLARYLRRTLAFQFGTEHFIRKHGAKAILEALHDGVMIWRERQVGRPGPDGQRIIETVEERIPNPRLRSPAAYLNHMLNDP